MPLTPPPAPLHGREQPIAVEVYQYLGRALLDGELQPGERLRDVAIAETLGVSRTPVREALLWLSQQGLIEISANRYTRVAVRAPERSAAAVEYMAYACGFGLHMALRRDDPAVRAQLLDGIDELMLGIDGGPEQVRAVVSNFFRRAAMVSGNVSYGRIMQSLELPIQLLMQGFVPFRDDPAGRVESYRALRDAISAGDGAEAERIVRAQHGIH
ncbi:GntR family transcriptional regulator [uncultured Microbacterium sp.]|mgnify:CR=1 FL=1|jgi:DNA-binding GntR family transcriptional regulator|uniref:GntR family transcriptional regulator n=1 Tax=uncultured Microbacterium sp. TaxID=191216 RepID=UPI0025FA0D5C|nr:GntR family transcriptional regulator [uncultured Microbacterium sp.]